jgi:hypothetical protein
MASTFSATTTSDYGYQSWTVSPFRVSRVPVETETTSSEASGSDSGVGTFIRGAAKARLERIKEFERRFIELARAEHFEYGYAPSTELFTLEFFQKNSSSLCIEALVRMFWSHTSETSTAVAVLNALSALPYDKEFKGGQTLAVAATAIADHEIKEAAIRVFERWGHPEGAEFLSKIDCPWPWLDDYRNQVIQDLSS